MTILITWADVWAVGKYVLCFMAGIVVGGAIIMAAAMPRSFNNI